MFNNIFGGLFGNASSQNIASNASQLQNSYNGQAGQAAMNSNHHAQQALTNQYAQAQISQLGRWKDTAPQWMIDGRVMSIQDFANEVYGDTPERTMFLLKYTKETE